MKIEFIHARYTGNYADLSKLSGRLKNLPETVYLGSSIQFIDRIDDTRRLLEFLGKKVIKITGRHSSVDGQILGCDIYNPESIITGRKTAEIPLGTVGQGESCFIIISTGEFHALSGTLAGLDAENKSDVFALNPITGELKKMDDKFSIKGQYLKFLSAENVGILITTKPGQHDRKDIADVDLIMKRYPGKRYYKIISDSISPQGLADFNYIDFFINTACPRMIDEKDSFPKTMMNIRNLLGADTFYNPDGKR